MEYSNEFKDLLLKSEESLIGWGNPNASILIIGKESAIPKDNDSRGREQYEREIIIGREIEFIVFLKMMLFQFSSVTETTLLETLKFTTLFTPIKDK